MRLVLILIILTSLGSPLAFGHGLGNDETMPVNISGMSVSATVTAPSANSGEYGNIIIRFKDTVTGKNIPHVTIMLTIEKGDKVFLSERFHSHDGVIALQCYRSEGVNIVAEKSELGWLSSSESIITVESPLFTEGGLYHYKMQVLTLGNDDIIIEDPPTLDAYVSTAEDKSYRVENSDITIRTFFDSIRDVRFTDKVEFSMPFNWDMTFVSQIPLLHMEVIIPKTASFLISDSYTGKINDIELPRDGLMIDDNNPDKRIVHFMVSREMLMDIASKSKIKDKAVFALEPRSEIKFPLDAYSVNENYKTQMSWSPAVIEAGKETMFIFNIRNRQNDLIYNSYYEFVIVKDGKEIYRDKKVAQIGADVQKFTFSEEHIGRVAIRLEKINNSDEYVEYTVAVVPEFYLPFFIITIGITISLILLRYQLNYRIK